ncbi:hypothetical protein LEP1GSC036_3296 [Leptospira weilii str. 2006001853]|uniref:Uncharacterized protein n=1 Tax=Leptospira weilii str. 2006001853 TaxID=1001589 RepID=A0A828Z4T2_9LEPT|nr:hypothetical protein LEP1GSC036_3296 [Leptospira weilii str. 2006001853]
MKLKRKIVSKNREYSLNLFSTIDCRLPLQSFVAPRIYNQS